MNLSDLEYIRPGETRRRMDKLNRAARNATAQGFIVDPITDADLEACWIRIDGRGYDPDQYFPDPPSCLQRLRAFFRRTP